MGHGEPTPLSRHAHSPQHVIWKQGGFKRKYKEQMCLESVLVEVQTPVHWNEQMA